MKLDTSFLVSPRMKIGKSEETDGEESEMDRV